ncbi:MAG: hypothetical protein AAF694_14935 [Bacteroidota bacterium]
MAEIFSWAFTLYFGLGLVFAVAFVLRGILRVDEDAKGTGFAFRLIVFPGAMAFWPVLLVRWLQSKPLKP